ncbi:hypothetical protein F5Y17DRAFT_472546 [Xylariaceae sp. FL0594]|nr:hypothetical protein F5Y17DRAFT_472546 [Xylariaceae sp. FL0594]
MPLELPSPMTARWLLIISLLSLGGPATASVTNDYVGSPQEHDHSPDAELPVRNNVVKRVIGMGGVMGAVPSLLGNLVPGGIASSLLAQVTADINTLLPILSDANAASPGGAPLVTGGPAALPITADSIATQAQLHGLAGMLGDVLSEIIPAAAPSIIAAVTQDAVGVISSLEAIATDVASLGSQVAGNQIQATDALGQVGGLLGSLNSNINDIVQDVTSDLASDLPLPVLQDVEQAISSGLAGVVGVAHGPLSLMGDLIEQNVCGIVTPVDGVLATVAGFCGDMSSAVAQVSSELGTAPVTNPNVILTGDAPTSTLPLGSGSPTVVGPLTSAAVSTLSLSSSTGTPRATTPTVAPPSVTSPVSSVPQPTPANTSSLPTAATRTTGAVATVTEYQTVVQPCLSNSAQSAAACASLPCLFLSPGYTYDMRLPQSRHHFSSEQQCPRPMSWDWLYVQRMSRWMVLSTHSDSSAAGSVRLWLAVCSLRRWLVLRSYPNPGTMRRNQHIEDEASNHIERCRPGYTTTAPAGKTRGFLMAGTESGDSCLCGIFLNGTEMMEDAACSMPCSGDSTQRCGGLNALSCYSPDGEPRGWASRGPQPLAPTIQPPLVESLDIGGVAHTRLTTPVIIFPPKDGDSGDIISIYAKTTSQPLGEIPGSLPPPSSQSSAVPSTPFGGGGVAPGQGSMPATSSSGPTTNPPASTPTSGSPGSSASPGTLEPSQVTANPSSPSGQSTAGPSTGPSTGTGTGTEPSGSNPTPTSPGSTPTAPSNSPSGTNPGTPGTTTSTPNGAGGVAPQQGQGSSTTPIGLNPTTSPPPGSTLPMGITPSASSEPTSPQSGTVQPSPSRTGTGPSPGPTSAGQSPSGPTVGTIPSESGLTTPPGAGAAPSSTPPSGSGGQSTNPSSSPPINGGGVAPGHGQQTTPSSNMEALLLAKVYLARQLVPLGLQTRYVPRRRVPLEALLPAKVYLARQRVPLGLQAHYVPRQRVPLEALLLAKVYPARRRVPLGLQTHYHDGVYSGFFRPIMCTIESHWRHFS